MTTRNLIGAVGVVVALLVIVLVVASGDDDGPLDGIEFRDGAPDAGFPLRGNLAKDRELAREAARSWQRRATRDGDRWAGDEAGRVVVLWAGRLSSDKVGVMLAADEDAVFMTRSDREAGKDRPYWMTDEATLVSDDDPSVVAAEGGVLVRDGERPIVRPAEVFNQPRRITIDDGFVHREDLDLPGGVVLLPAGLGFVKQPVAALYGVLASSTPTVAAISPALQQRWTSGPESRPGPAAQRLVDAARAAQGRSSKTGRSSLLMPLAELEFVAERSVPTYGPATLVSADNGDPRRRTQLAVAFGGSNIGNGPEPWTVRLKTDGSALQSPARTDIGLGAAFIRRRSDERPRLLVGATPEVREIRVLAGRRTLTVTAPVGVAETPWDRRKDRSSADVVVEGRTGAGDVVAPGPVEPEVAGP